MSAPRVILLNDTSSYNHHGCHLVVEQIRHHCKNYGLDLWYTVKLGDDWRAERHRNCLSASNIVLINGEGSLHHDKKSALILSQSAAFCRERNIPCFLINSGYQDNGEEMAHLVRQFDLVFVRESRSQTELRKWGIESEVVPDMTLSHPDLPRMDRDGIMVTDSSSAEASMQLHKFYTRTHGVRFASLFKPISTAHTLRMLATQMIGKRAPKLWQFERRCRSQISRSPFSPATSQPTHELFRGISKASLIVTGRFHMVCLAMLARTPFIALAGNTHKIEGMLADAGLSNRYRLFLPNGGDLLKWSEWREDEMSRMEAYLQQARSRIAQMFSRIFRFCNFV